MRFAHTTPSILLARFILCWCALASLPAAHAQVVFTKDTLSAVATSGGATFGPAWVDIDNDGDLDLFAVNYNGQNNVLFRNDSAGSFSALGAGEAGSIVADGGNSFGTAWGDYDNDGDIDAFVANASPTVTNEADFLYRNDGTGLFTRVLAGPIATAGGFTTGASWVDYDNDGFLDLFAVNNNQVNFLFHNSGNGSFSRILTGDIVTSVARFHGCSWSDYDNDGDMDVFVACNIGSANRLYKNNGDGTFTKVTSGAIVTDVGSAQGASWGDYDNDGDMDLFVPNRSNQDNALYRNNGNGTFTKVSAPEAGQMVSDGGDSFGSAWSDVDNDGDLDLFVANWSGQDNFLYLNNNDGSFTRELSGAIVHDGGESQAAVFGDYDRDGFEDLYVANGYFANGNDFLYHNEGNANHWLTVSCTGTSSNRSAIGTKVRIRAVIGGETVWQFREIAEQTGAFGHGSLHAHFGLGDAAVVDSIVIEWPSGLREFRSAVPADQYLSIVEEAPPPPELLSASAGDSSVELRWTRSRIANFGYYVIYADTLAGTLRVAGTLPTAAETTLTLTGLENRRLYYVSVAVANTDSLVGDPSDEFTATPLPLVSMQVAVAGRWNLVSLPLRVVDSSAAALFPSAEIGPFAYGAGGYSTPATLGRGKGYWVKYASPGDVPVSGFEVMTDSVRVSAGWNLIGSVTQPVAVSAIGSVPPGLTTGAFFGYRGKYEVADTLRPGEGYWVKAGQAGVLVLAPGAVLEAEAVIRIRPDGDWPPPSDLE